MIIKGTGIYAPGKPISNKSLKELAKLEFDTEKLEDKLGIKERHIAKLNGLKETTADFAQKASIMAIRDSGLNQNDIDLFIVATDTPEYISPSTAVLIQGRIQKKEKRTMSFDVNASCAGFVTAFDIASRIIDSNPSINNAVITGVYNMPSFIRNDDSFSLPIFADGAGSIVIGKNNKSKFVDSEFITDGTQWDYIGIYAGGAKKPVTPEMLNNNNYGLQLLKPLPGSRNIELWPPMVEKLIKRNKLEKSDIDHIIFTQINKSVILKVLDILGLSKDKTTMVMDKYGYTGSACIPMAFHHALKENSIKRGDKVIFVASGAGLSAGGNLFIY